MFLKKCHTESDSMNASTSIELKILFSTGKVINLLQVSTKGIVLQHTPIQEWPVHIYFQDMDWSRGLIYWTDDEGELMRYNKKTKAKVIIPTIVPGELCCIRPSI